SAPWRERQQVENACLAQVWASRKAPAGPTLHGVSKSIAPRGVCPQLQMCSSRTERGGVRQEYVGAIRPLVIERDTIILSQHMQLDPGVRRHDGRGMSPNLHRVANGRAGIIFGGHVQAGGRPLAEGGADVTQWAINVQAFRATRHLPAEVLGAQCDTPASSQQ